MLIAELILRSLQQPVLVLDGTLRPVIANPAFFQMFDLSPADLEGKFIPELIYGEICEPSLRVVIESVIANETNGVASRLYAHWGWKKESTFWRTLAGFMRMVCRR